MKTKTTKPLPKLLVIRPKRDACKVFYSKFKLFDVDYLDIGVTNNLLPKFIRGLSSKIKKTDIVCITDNYYFYNLQAVMLASFYKKPIVTILWCTIPHHISSWLLPYSFITKRVVESTKLFILRNKSAIPFAKSIGVPMDKIKVIYKGIDLDKFYPRKKDKENEIINILYVGKNIKSKGVYDLNKAFRMLKKDGMKIDLKLISKTPYEDLPRIYRDADIFCSPSREIKLLGIKIWEEYFSYTLMEAQASGLPIVTTRSVGVLEEVDARNEFTKKGNVPELYRSLKKIVEDRVWREKLGKINRKRAEMFFDDKIQARKTEEEILKLC